MQTPKIVQLIHLDFEQLYEVIKVGLEKKNLIQSYPGQIFIRILGDFTPHATSTETIAVVIEVTYTPPGA